MKLLVFDGNSIINRAFYAIKLLSTSEGVFTNGIFGFINIMEKEIAAENPDGVVVAFDLKAPTFRHAEYTEYKSHRKPMPEELAMQMPLLKELLDAMHVSRIEKEGYEADDLIGTIARRCEQEGKTCVIVTGDKDDLQLVSDKTVCKLTTTSFGKSSSKAYTREVFEEEYGFAPEKMIDLKALMGDASDNIPGVAGIGEKTASDLIIRFGSVEEIYENLEKLDIKQNVRDKLTVGRDVAFLSKRLATICTDIAMELQLEKFQLEEPDFERLMALYSKLELRTFASRLTERMPKQEAAQQNTVQEARPVEWEKLKNAPLLAVMLWENELSVSDGEGQYTVSKMDAGGTFDAVVSDVMTCGAKKIVHHKKELVTRLGEFGIAPNSVVFDVSLAAYLLNPSASAYRLPDLAFEFLGQNITENAQTAVQALYQLHPVMEQKLAETGMARLYYETELPLSDVLADMERVGFAVDKGALRAFGDTLIREIDEVSAQVYTLCGEQFNINSPKQLGDILFEKLGLPAGKKGKTGYKTDADTLNKLSGKYPVVSLILRYRQLTKLNSTYVEGLLKVIGTDGRIHTTFQQTVTQTGRISSTEPNLQNIPVRDALGRELRRMFAAAEGYTLLDADYSQIELRVLAHIAGDEAMLAAFRNNEDIHTFTASQVFDLPPEFITPELRRRAKAVNFGIVYGISAFSLADDIGVTNKEAKQYIESYFERYPGVKAYLDRTVAQAKENGYVTTLYGRRRQLPELKSTNFVMRSFGERVAMNTPIQGTAADIIKMAMVRVGKALKEGNYKSRLILQVHDELIVEAVNNEVEPVRQLLAKEMQGAANLLVPLLAEVKAGRTWYDAK